MKVKDIIQQVEHITGRQPEQYLLRLINDALLDIAIKKQHYKKDVKIDLVENQRWYDLEDDVVDITRVEVLGTDDRYVMIPKLSNPDKLLREDEY
tara:strand:- start:4306 stop:4590 length:285 start_codon:yes stop_codon:yes gene_type:complete